MEVDLYPVEVRRVPLSDGYCLEIVCRSFSGERYVVHVTGKTLEDLKALLLGRERGPDPPR